MLNGKLIAAGGMLTAVGAAAYAAHNFMAGKSEEMRERARGALHTSQVLGTDVESASRLNAVGFTEEAGSHFQKSLFDNSEGFKNLGLDARKLAAEPLTQALAEVGEALKKTQNPADRAAAAMEIFGHSGAELIPVLTGLKKKLDAVSESAVVTAEKVEKTKQYDAAKALADRQWSEGGEHAARDLGVGEDFETRFQRYKGAYAANIFGGKQGTADYWEKVEAEKTRVTNAGILDKFRPGVEAQARQKAEDEKRRAEWKKQQDEARAAIAGMGLTSEGGMIAAQPR